MPEELEKPIVKDVKEVNDPEEKVSISLLEKLMSVFKPDTTPPPVTETPKVDETVDVESIVQEKLNELMPELKKKQSKELEEKEAALLLKEQQLEEQKVIDSLVDDNFVDFVKFEAQNKGLSINDYIEQNKQYAKSKAPVIDTTNKETKQSIVDEILERRKNKGFN